MEKFFVSEEKKFYRIDPRPERIANAITAPREISSISI